MCRSETSLGITLALVSLLLSSPALAGPWVRGFGDGYTKVEVSGFAGDNSVAQGQATDLVYSSIAIETYAELGLPERFQLTLGVPWIHAINESGDGTEYVNDSIGDVRVALDRGVGSGPIPMTVGVEVKIPAYRQPVDQSSADGLDDALFPTLSESFPQVGDGNVDVTPRFQIGLSGLGGRGWLTAAGGYRFRLARFQDGPYAALGLGYFVVPRYLALGAYADAVGRFAYEKQEYQDRTGENVFVQGYVIGSLPGVDGLGLTASFGGTVYAEQWTRGTRWSAGLSWTF